MEGMCKCSHHKAVPMCIILIGLSFLLARLNILTEAAVAMIWPILLIIIGFTKIKKCKCCSGEGKCC